MTAKIFEGEKLSRTIGFDETITVLDSQKVMRIITGLKPGEGFLYSLPSQREGEGDLFRYPMATMLKKGRVQSD